MAKQQTFADKAKGKGPKSELQTVKCIVSYKDEQTGTWKFRERRVKVKDVNDLDSMNI